MFVMYDSVDVGQIPNAPHAVAGYVNGNYANIDQIRKRFPRTRILEISVTGTEAHQAYDIEKGDYNPEQAGELFESAKAAGIWRPCFYADLSNMPAVKASLDPHLKERSEVRLWVAYYNGLADLPAGYDAHQFTETALGRNLDESVCADTFFQPAKPAPDKAAAAKVTFDTDSGSWDVSPLPEATVPA